MVTNLRLPKAQCLPFIGRTQAIHTCIHTIHGSVRSNGMNGMTPRIILYWEGCFLFVVGNVPMEQDSVFDGANDFQLSVASIAVLVFTSHDRIISNRIEPTSSCNNILCKTTDDAVQGSYHGQFQICNTTSTNPFRNNETSQPLRMVVSGVPSWDSLVPKQYNIESNTFRSQTKDNKERQRFRLPTHAGGQAGTYILADSDVRVSRFPTTMNDNNNNNNTNNNTNNNE